MHPNKSNIKGKNHKLFQHLYNLLRFTRGKKRGKKWDSQFCARNMHDNTGLYYRTPEMENGIVRRVQ